MITREGAFYCVLKAPGKSVSINSTVLFGAVARRKGPLSAGKGVRHVYPLYRIRPFREDVVVELKALICIIREMARRQG